MRLYELGLYGPRKVTEAFAGAEWSNFRTFGGAA